MAAAVDREPDGLDRSVASNLLAADYHERALAPEDTVAKLRTHWKRLGITRLADQTGLDRLGIPCFAAFRPNSRSLANNQGKGLTAAFARASAIMEATEFAVAEDPYGPFFRSSLAALEASGMTAISPDRFLPADTPFHREQAVDWMTATNVFDESPVAVPRDLVTILGQEGEIPGISRTTNGLASGNTRAEALFHGLCEIIERDAFTFWSFLDWQSRLRRVLDPRDLADPVVSDLVDRVEQAGMTMRLFDQTHDLGVPTIMAAIGDLRASRDSYCDLAAGYGTHPVPARAAIRAITEAAQSRITSIAGARDDIPPATYSPQISARAVELLNAGVRGSRPWPNGLFVGASLEACHRYVFDRLNDAGLRNVAALEMAPPELDIAVVRVICPDLEDRGANANWRPGNRVRKITLGTVH